MKTPVVFITIISIIMVFQNCSDVKLEKLQKVTQQSLSKPNSTICAPIGSSFTSPMRFVFIIDMSMSNVGSLNVSTFDYVSTYNINEKDGPSDLNGERFNQVSKFISECGGSTNSSYSVMGFSRDNFFSKSNSCLSPFESQQEALASVQALKEMQFHDLNISSRERTNPYYLQGETYYSSGLNCLKIKINEDLNLLVDDKPVYNVFFITDGMATDPTENQNYGQILSDLSVSTSEKAGGINFYPVYYTSGGAKNQGEQKTEAIQLLDQLAAVIDKDQKTTFLGDISTQENELCKKLSKKSQVQFKLKTLYGVNLNLMLKNNEVKVDSDSDGLPDDLEIQLGWKIDNSHSTGVLDILCYKSLNDKELCKEEVSTLQCDSEVGRLGLTDCDLKFAANVYGKPLDGVDTDKDGIIDLIEILRGMNPNRIDTYENPSGDGVINIKKIFEGLDIFSSLISYPIGNNKKLGLQFEESLDKCSDNRSSYSFELTDIPMVNTVSFPKSSLTENLNFTHLKNENIVLLISHWQTEGGLNLPEKIFYQKVKVNLKNSIFNIFDSELVGEAP
jgi:hypothetical protein